MEKLGIKIRTKRNCLADEISPDTCRLWDSKTEKKLDKDRFRKDLRKYYSRISRSC